ncbi:PPOX class F420-dependent oxidoreductase [Mariniluteicoccus endophyticus]
MTQVTLTESARRLLDGRTFAVLSTINPDGSPQLTTMWVRREGDQVVFSTVEGRQKPKNMRRDPRVSLLMYDPENPYHYVEIRGTAELERDPASLIDELSQKYTGQDWKTEPEGTVRLVVRVTPTKIVEH